MLQNFFNEQTNTPKLNPGTVWDRYNEVPKAQTCADVVSTVYANNVCHFYVDFNIVKSEHPQTPKLMTLTFTAPDSDQGKEEAQRKLARRMSCTPNNLHL